MVDISHLELALYIDGDFFVNLAKGFKTKEGSQ
jgi:hypothetical protein